MPAELLRLREDGRDDVRVGAQGRVERCEHPRDGGG